MKYRPVGNAMISSSKGSNGARRLFNGSFGYDDDTHVGERASGHAGSRQDYREAECSSIGAVWISFLFFWERGVGVDIRRETREREKGRDGMLEPGT